MGDAQNRGCRWPGRLQACYSLIARSYPNRVQSVPNQWYTVRQATWYTTRAKDASQEGVNEEVNEGKVATPHAVT